MAFLFLSANPTGAATSHVNVTAATGGSAISADSASGAWTTLTGPTAAEVNPGDIGAGTIIFAPPAGFVFNSGVTVTVKVSVGSATPGNNVNDVALNGTFSAFVAADGSSITTTITNVSALANEITWQNIQVRPTAGTPLANGSIAQSGTSVLNGLSAPSGWGTLAEVPGAVTKMMVTLPNQVFTSGSGNAGAVTNQSAGITFNISKLTAIDQFTNTVTSYSGSKTITYTGPGGTPSYTTSVSFSSGQSTTTLATTLRKAETTTITATDGTLSGVPSSSLTIGAGAFTGLQLLAPGETAAPGTTSGKTGTRDAQIAGVSFSVAVNAVDANWNLISTNDTVHIGSSDGAAALPANAALAGGTQAFSVTLKTAPGQTVTASDVTHPGAVSDTVAISVNAASPALVRVETAANGSGTIVPAQTVFVGNSITVYSISRDAFTNFVANTVAGSWSLTAITGGVIAGDLVPAGDSRSAVFTAHATGTARIHASSGALASTDSGTLTASLADTTTSLVASTNPSVFGQTVTFTAAVAVVPPGTGTPTGTVTFKDAGASLGTRTLNGSGQAAFNTASLSVAVHSITAVYNGDGNYNASTSSSLTQTVNRASTTAAVSSSANPSVAGQSVTFTATVSAAAPGSGTPSGTVTFKDGAATLGTGTLSSGQATFTTGSLSGGPHSIAVVYGGDSSFNTSTSSILTQTINKASSTTAVASSVTPSVFGQSVTFTATVSAVAPGSGTPTGTVTFKEGATSLATNVLSSAQATYTTAALSVAAHSITAVYNGDGNFNASTSGPLSQTVNKADTTAAVTSSTNPSVFGQAIVFAATLSAASPGAGAPSGTVTFSEGAATLATNILSAGTANYTNTTFVVGAHPITAVYNGDGNFNGCASGAATQTVTRANTTLALGTSTNPSVIGQSVTFTAAVTALAPGAGIASGSVTFKDGAATLGTGTLSSGQATFATNSLGIGSHSISAVYGGDANFDGSDNTGSPLIQIVNPTSTITSLSSSTNPSVFGQPVTFTATVSPAPPAGGTPTGIVTFKDGITTLGSGTLTSGQTTFTTTGLSAATHSITAIYGGDGDFNTSTSSALNQVVNKSGTTTALVSSVNPSVFSESVTFTATVSASAPGSGTATGTVTFKDGPTALSTNALSSGQAGFSTTTLALGTHSITAVYNGDQNFNTSTNSPALTQTVNKDNVTVSLSSSTNPTVFGEPVILTASVAALPPGSGTPTGTVTFRDGASALATRPLVSGQVTYTNGALSVGAHLLTAVYNGDMNFSTNTSLVITQTVNQAATTTTVSSSTNPSVFGQSVSFNAMVAAVAPAAGTASGSVTFKDGATTLGTGTLSGGQATFSTSLLSVAAHSITALYGGDSNFTSSDNTNSPLVQTVSPANSTTAVSSSVNPSAFGQSVTFTATVAPVAPGADTCTGTVQFSIDGGAFGGPVSLSGGAAASAPISSLSVAGHAVTAAYSGDGKFNGSDNIAGPLIQTVNKAGTSATLASSTNPSVFGQEVVFTATVGAAAPGAGNPSGTVTFKDGAGALATNTLAGGQANYTNAALPAGSHPMTAVYNGDANFNTCTSSALGQTVSKAASSTTLASSQNPSLFGQPVTFTATVTAAGPGAGTPGGTVTFKDGATPLATNSLSGGVASFGTALLAAATHTITAIYNGDGNFNASTNSPALSQVVNKSDTATALTSSTNPAAFGQVVNFTATVSPVAPGSGTPTGSVTFKDGAATLGTGTLSAGQATFSTPSLAVAAHPITAVFGGDGDFNPSTSATVTQIVNQANTTTALASTPNPSVFGQSLTLTATVTPAAPGAGTPGGTVTFMDGASALGTGTLSSGQANFTTAALNVGAHSLSTIYHGNGNFNASTSSALNQAVNKANTTSSVVSSLNPSLAGDPVSFTATVAAISPGAGTPGGTVQFVLDGTNFGGAATLTGGSAASSSITSLSQGTHTVWASYGGDGSFNACTSGSLGQIVNAPQITPATGGGAISADTTGGSYTALTGPIYSETASGQASVGQMVLNAANGFIFDTGGVAPTVLMTRIAGSGSSANNINNVASGTAMAMTSVTSTQLVFTVTDSSVSGVACRLAWQNVRVRPTAGAPLAGGNLWMGITNAVVGLSTNSNCGTLQEVAGSPAQLVIQAQPSATATAGVIFAQQPILQVRDQFGTLRSIANGVSDNTTVVSGTRSGGAGVLQGTTSRTAVDGIVTYTNLSHNVATNMTILFSSGSLSSATSGTIAITAAAASSLAYAVQPANATVGAIFGTQPVLKSQDAFGNDSTLGLPPGLIVTLSLGQGTGPLQGTTALDIGAGAGNGIVSGTDLRIDAAGTDKQLSAAATGLGSVSSSVFTVNPASSTTTVASAINPSVFGQLVTFTATVSVPSGSGAPTGTVTFKDGTTTLGSGPLNSSQAAFSTSALGTGSHPITAVYNGDGNFSPSVSSSLGQTVNKSDSTATLISSTNPAVFGQAVVFTASVSPVAPGSGTPAGTVTFLDGALALSTNTLVSGQVNYTNSSLWVVEHSITVLYNGDGSFNSSNSGVVTQTVNRANTTTTVAGSANPSVFGQSITFTATVNPVAPGGGPRTGVVQFSIDGSAFGSPVSLSGGTATCGVLSSLPVASHTVTATYSGDANFIGSDNTDSPMTQTVDPANTTTAISSSANPSVSGQPATFTANVSAVAPGAGTPTGIVTFKDGAATLGTGTLNSGQATFSTNDLSVMTHPITAVYSGDGDFNTSLSSTLSQVVNKSGSSTVLASSLNPSVFGQSVTFTATVTALAPGIGTPAGTVTFRDGVAELATTALSAGQATFSTAALSVAAHSITAEYNGDGSFDRSTNSPTLAQTVAKDGTFLSLVSSTNPTVFSQPVTFTAIVTAAAPGAGTPTGTVTFNDGAVPLATNSLSGGVANLTTAALAAGAHSLTAVYNGDASFSPSSNSPALSQTVTAADTTATLVSSANPSAFGQPVTLTASVSAPAPGSGPATGSVIFQDGTVALATNTLSGGQTSFTNPAFSLGSHPITAIYNATANFNGSTSSILTQAVIQAATTTTVASSANPGVFGQSLTFTASVTPVAPGAGTCLGTVQFSIDGSAFGGPVSLSGASATSGAVASLAVGVHAVTAVYNGDSNFTGSDNLAAPFHQTINKASTATVLASSSNPSLVGDPVTFTATVTATSPGNGTPTGTVTFKNGATPLGTNSLSAGETTFTASFPTVGSHPITAVYNSDDNFNTSTSATLAQTVNGLATTTTLVSSTNPAIFGQSITLAATVASSAGSPTGTVTFRDGATALSTNTLNGSQQAAFTTATLSAGSHSLTAVYTGDSTHLASTNSPPLAQTVNKSDTTVTLISSTNPTVFGQPVIFSVSVAPVLPGAGTAAGTVIFKEGATALRTNTLVSGQTTYTNSTLPAGTHTITALYNGDANFNTNTSAAVVQAVNIANSTTIVASSANPSVFGQLVTFTATVSPVAPSAGSPTGSVQFAVDGSNVGSPVTVSGGTATLATAALSVAGHTVSATYSGDANFVGSVSGNLTQTVNKAATTTVVGSSLNPSYLGQPVTFTASLTIVSPGAGSPSGTVQFSLDGTNVGSGVGLVGSTASLDATTYLGLGTHTTSAVYTGDGNFNPSTSANLSQIVNPSPVTRATGGTNISADATGGPYTNLAGPAYQEPGVAAVQPGSIILNAPPGFMFDTGGIPPNVLLNGGSNAGRNINNLTNGATIAVSVTTTNLTINITSASASGSGSAPNKLTWQNIRVRPAAGTPLATGVVTKSGSATLVGVSDGFSSFGTLTEIAGEAKALGILTQPASTATAGAAFARQPVIEVRDQFGNLRSAANGNPDNSTVVEASRAAGTGALQGTLSATASNGAAAFNNLSYNKAETITISFASGALTNATSGNVIVSPAAASQLAFTTQPGSATYGSALSPQPALKSYDAFGNESWIGLAPGQLVTLALSAGTGSLQGTTSQDIGSGAGNGTVTFTGLQVSAAGTGKQLSATAPGLTGTNSASFDVAQATVSASVTANNKVYDAAAQATIAARSLSGVIGSDDVNLGASGAASFASKTVGSGRLVTVTGLSLSGTAAGNYQLSSTTATTVADITPAPLTVTGIIANNKTYDRYSAATLEVGAAALDTVLSGDSVALNAGGAVGMFADKNVGTNKTVTVSGLTISGADSGNYLLTQPTTTANITAAGLAVAGVTADNKPYDGLTTATIHIAGVALVGALAGDDLTLNIASAAGAFDDPNAGTSKTVTIAGVIISGSDAGNYALAQPTALADITSVPLLVVAEDKSRGYGAANPPFTFACVGFVNGEDSGALAGAPSLITAADTNSPTGAYPIAISLGTLSNANYSLSFSNGTLSVTQAVLLATADDKTRAYGAANPVLTVSYSGFVNGQDAGILGGSPDLNTPADSASPVGVYPITIAQGSLNSADTNYSLVVAEGNLTITPVGLTITADNKSKTYGEADPPLTYQVASGALVNGDTLAGALGREPGENAGVYSILQGGLSATANYTLAYVGANLVIFPAQSAVAVASSANPAPTGSNVTFTAGVTINPPGGGTPDGNVQFLVDGAAFGWPVSLSGGMATLTTSNLAHGYHTVAAAYAGTANFVGSTNALSPDELINSTPVAGSHSMSAGENQATVSSITDLLLLDSDGDGDALHISDVSPSSAQGGRVVLNSPTIVYTPPTNFVGADSFTYTLADTFDATATATVYVTVVATAVPIVIIEVAQLQDGNFQIKSSGVPGTNYLLQAASDPAGAWTTLLTNAADVTGVSTFVDLAATNYNTRFYRTARP